MPERTILSEPRDSPKTINQLIKSPGPCVGPLALYYPASLATLGLQALTPTCVTLLNGAWVAEWKDGGQGLGTRGRALSAISSHFPGIRGQALFSLSKPRDTPCPLPLEADAHVSALTALSRADKPQAPAAISPQPSLCSPEDLSIVLLPKHPGLCSAERCPSLQLLL